MPHYLIQLDDKSDDEFAVYSTIIDGLVSEVMSPKSVMEFLNEDTRYATWLKPYDPEQIIADWYADSSEDMKQHITEQARYFYWHPEGFAYNKLTDAYVCLPRSSWRNGR